MKVGMRMQPPDYAQHQRNVAEVRAAMDDKAFAQAWAEGPKHVLGAGAGGHRGGPAAQAVEPAPAARPALPGGEQVTAREREVAALIAQGLTNIARSPCAS